MRKIFSLIKKSDFYFLSVLLILVIYYLIEMRITKSYLSFFQFNSKLVMDTAQIARNTMRGDFFVTKYILPVGYAFFPTVINHPDFIRYPLPILVYALLFKVFSPSALYVRLLNAFLFIVNGGLIYKLALKILNLQGVDDEQKKSIRNWLALFVAVTSSVFSFSYLQMALSDYYEVISYTMLLLTLLLGFDRKINPILFGMVCGLLYLSKPTFSLLIFAITVYYLMPRRTFKDWFLNGLLCVAGFAIVISPFVIRSLLLTGEPLFALQHRIESISGVVLSHDELYKTFDIPPSVIGTISNYKAIYINRWIERVTAALRDLFVREYSVAWVGTTLLLLLNEKVRAFVFSYFAFLILHVVIVANYLDVIETWRIYTILLAFLMVLGMTGVSLILFKLLNKLGNIHWRNTALVSLLLCSLLLAGVLSSKGALTENSVGKEEFSKEVVKLIKGSNPTCIYSNMPYEAAWFLDIPVVYPPINLADILSVGPKECNYYFSVLPSEKETDFLSKHGSLIFERNDQYYYKIDH